MQNAKMPLTAEQRHQRIAELEREIAELRRQDNEEKFADNKAKLLEECRQMKKEGRPVDACKLFRNWTGCGLKDAFLVIQGL